MFRKIRDKYWDIRLRLREKRQGRKASAKEYVFIAIILILSLIWVFTIHYDFAIDILSKASQGSSK